jgi:hypothetical protein
MSHTSTDGADVAVTFHEPVNGTYGRIVVHSARTKAKVDIDRTDLGTWCLMLHMPRYNPSAVIFPPETHQGTVTAFGRAFLEGWLDH